MSIDKNKLMKIGIITLYRGYNYGTSLQAYALKKFISSLGYDAQIIWTKEGAYLGRDIRLNKILKMFSRMIIHPQLLKKNIMGYKNTLMRKIDDDIKTKFIEFARQELKIKTFTKKEIVEYVKSDDVKAVVCGSDQIWNAESANMEPMYYLRFVPKYKRVAYAPSFGRKDVPKYNEKTLIKYLTDIPYISVREDDGAIVVKKLIGRDVPVLMDPTLLLDWQEWKTVKNNNYIVAYFLDKPTKTALNSLKYVSEKYNYKILAFPYKYKNFNLLKNISYPEIGPKDFIEIIGNSKCVFTDSFHGTIFSINMNIPFWTFERNSSSGSSQKSRLNSILNKLNMGKQYITGSQNISLDIPLLSFKESNEYIQKQRIKSKEYLIKSFSDIEGKNDKD